jgi:uncharacterized repeat protein (TIGR01451 family)
MSKLLLACVLLFTVSTSFSQIVNIPDANFKAHLVNYTNPVIDTNGDGEIQVSEAEAIGNEQLNLNNVGISDLTGLEAFVNLQRLSTSNNLFTSLDVSSLSALEVLNIVEYQLELINFSNISNIIEVYITSDSLTELDIENQVNLEIVSYSDNDLINPTLSSVVLPNTQSLIRLELDHTLIENIDVSNFINLEYLSFFRGQLNSIDITKLSNLEGLLLTGNNLSEIDVSQNNNLNFLAISDQEITTVDISNLSLLEHFNFNRSDVSTIDLSNNPLLKRLYVWETELSNIDLSNNTQLDIIFIHDTEISELDISNNSQLTQLSINNTFIEEINFSNNPLIEILNISNLNINEIDISVIPFLKTFQCENTSLTEINFSQNSELIFANLNLSQFETLDFSNSNNLQTLRAEGLFDLHSINIKNVSLPDLNLQASNNPNLNFICVDDIPLAIAQNFNIPPFTTFVDDCNIASGDLNFIEGTVTYDANDNNCGTGAVPLNNYLINANNGTSNFANTTNENGAYSVKVSEGTFTTQVLGLPPYFDTTPATASSTFVGFDQTDTADFCVQPNTTANDLTVSVFPVTEARPGFEADYEIIYENVGTTTLTGEVTVAFSDVQVDFVSATPAPNNQTSNSLTFNVGSLGPLQQGSIFTTFLLEQPPVNESGDILPYTITITPTAGDATPANNEFYFPQIIVNSFDPNDKTCVQGTQVLFEDAANYLHYIVRFQNLGTASAINVRVVDVLDELLDFSTFRVLSASHEMQTTLNDGQIDFIFDNINLPAEINDPEGSNGYITFKIKPVSTIALFDEVNNRADIYFDFNPPVLTNTTSTTFVDVLGIEEVTKTDIVVFPNPATTLINIQSSSTIEAIEIWNTLGQKINAIQISADKKQVAISALASGLYFMKIRTGDGIGVKQFVKK